MTGKEEFFDLVDRGRLGQNIGLSIGSPKLELYMDGFLPGTSYLVGGESGTGKTTYALWALLYQPLINFLQGNQIERDPYWIMFSLEIKSCLLIGLKRGTPIKDNPLPSYNLNDYRRSND